jgi:hypothetical protein
MWCSNQNQWHHMTKYITPENVSRNERSHDTSGADFTLTIGTRMCVCVCVCVCTRQMFCLNNLHSTLQASLSKFEVYMNSRTEMIQVAIYPQDHDFKYRKRNFNVFTHLKSSDSFRNLANCHKSNERKERRNKHTQNVHMFVCDGVQGRIKVKRKTELFN